MENLDWASLTKHLDVEMVLQIATLLVCAGLIGFERQISNKPSGIRTSILISLGAMIFTKYSIITFYEISNHTTGDPTRVIGQIVTGVGFLGAGTIMNREGLVVGLTTAATIWVQSAIGVLIGLGYLLDAFVFSILTFVILYGVTRLESRFKGVIRRQRHREVIIE
jgi:putative Mg2+ transporter-C (MgtC) family protein